MKRFEQTLNIPGLGIVKLKHVSLRDISDSIKEIEHESDEDQPEIFTNYILSRIVINPELSPDDISKLDSEPLEGLINFAIKGLDIIDFYKKYSSQKNLRVRFYEAFMEHEKQLYKEFSFPFRKNIVNLTGSIRRSYFNNFKELTKSFSINQQIFDKHIIHTLSITPNVFDSEIIGKSNLNNIIEASKKIVELTKPSIAATKIYEKQLKTIFIDMDEFTKQISSNLAAINISLKNTVSLGLFDELIKTYNKQKDLVDACNQSGWPLAPSMSQELREKIVQMHKGGKTQYISQTIMGYYRKNDCEKLKTTVQSWKDNEHFKKRMHIIQDALDAHCRKQFTLSVPAILPQIEGILSDYVEKNGLSAKLGKIGQVYKAAIGDEKDYGLSDWVIASTVLFHLENNTYIFTSFDEEINKSDKTRRVTRHTISHGLSVNYDKPIHSLKAFLILDAISALQKP
jgi:hypothetical protein